MRERNREIGRERERERERGVWRQNRFFREVQAICLLRVRDYERVFVCVCVCVCVCE